MVKRVDRLTQAQIARMPEWRDRWIKIGLSCDPMTEAERRDVERSLCLLYRKANLPELKSIQFVSSPFALRLATGFAGGAIHAVRKGWPAGSSAVRSAVDSAVRSAVHSAVHSAVGSAVDSAVRSAVDSAVRSAVHSAVHSAVDSAVRSAVRSAVHSAVDSAVRSAVDSAVRSAVDSAVGSAVHSAVHSAVDSAVDSAVVQPDSPAHFLLQCANNAGYIEWGGAFWPGYAAWATFFRDVCALELEQADAFAAFEVLSSECGFYSLHHDFAMVADRPTVLRRDGGGRLHADNGPAIAWRDGWDLFFWHGYQIPRSHEWVIEQPARLTLDAIFAERNAELRRIAFEIGMSRPQIVAAFAERAKLIAADDLHGQPRRLLELKLGNEPVRMIEVNNGSLEPDGSRRRFHLAAARLNGNPASTPHDAIAASYGIAPEHYREAVRT